jgi:prepilin-type N-terminal cleavage/methylation domain-containing protein
MLTLRKESTSKMCARRNGFTLLETLVSLTILLAVSGIVMSGITQLLKTQGTIANRTDMHTSVRSATELLSQEIGQAGSVDMVPPGTSVTMSAVALGTSIGFTLTPNTANIFAGEQLLVDDGLNPEVVTVITANGPPNTNGTANFLNAHPAGTQVYALGAFATGIVPPDANSGACTNPAGYTPTTNGSTCNKLKLYGDLNGDGNMLYVEYSCNQGTSAAPGVLYRNQMSFNAAAKPKVDPTMILLNNILQNPNDPNNNAVPCFSYQTRSDSSGNTYVVDVAVTMTVQTQNLDSQTQQFQTETKALLNVSPRNVFDAYVLASIGQNNRIQPMPTSVTNLLP